MCAAYVTLMSKGIEEKADKHETNLTTLDKKHHSDSTITSAEEIPLAATVLCLALQTRTKY